MPTILLLVCTLMVIAWFLLGYVEDSRARDTARIVLLIVGLVYLIVVYGHLLPRRP